MARRNSFFLPPEAWPARSGDTVRLDGGEAHHIHTVLRSRVGDEVRLFDGDGHEGAFRILSLRKNRAELEALSLAEHPAPTSGVTLAIGWGKSKRRPYLFEKAVELKALGLAFWTASRSQGEPPDEAKESWRDKCVQAAKQCGNPFLPRLALLPGIPELLAFAAGFDRCYLAWEAEEATAPLTPGHLAGCRSLVVIGPEGGLELDEARALIDGGFAPVTLGNSILRWETAATYCLSLGFFAGQDVK